jgi:putative redox protein
MSDQRGKTVSLTLQDGMRFDGLGEDGVRVALDSGTDHGGTASGFRPMELLLVALGGCAGMDVVSILRKKRQQVDGYRIELSGVQATDHPYVYTEISMHHTFRGDNLAEDAVRRAIELSETKYCSAYAMLVKAARINSSFEIQPAAPSD